MNEDARNFTIQGILLLFYVGLSILFSLNRKTWPMSLYYLGCLVKDAGVLLLGWFLVHKK